MLLLVLLRSCLASLAKFVLHPHGVLQITVMGLLLQKNLSSHLPMFVYAGFSCGFDSELNNMTMRKSITAGFHLKWVAIV